MSAPNNGGSAFPHPGYHGIDGKFVDVPHVGMTLRDWFAGMALNGIIERDTEHSKYELVEDNCETAKECDADGNVIHIQPNVANVYDIWEAWHEVAEASYALADAMLAVREGRKP
jgi:hypothetical protein